MSMNEAWQARVEEIRDDSTSGATALMTRALAILREAAAESRGTLTTLADALCRAQPSMAGLQTAADMIGRSGDPASDLDRLTQQIARAPGLIARHAAALLMLRPGRSRGVRERPLRLVTCSSSTVVEATIKGLSAQVPVGVCCAEARPRLEGRAMAIRLADRGVRTELYTDAGISMALPDADALLVGADAVGPSHFINKVGTGALCALAASVGVPVYVLAGREKILDASRFASLSLRRADPAEVWPHGHPGVLVQNPYFELVPLRLVSTVVTDSGPRHMT